jgi:hypothetical protein
LFQIGFYFLKTGVADPDSFYTDPDLDPAFLFDSDPDHAFQFDTDPDLTV